MADESVPLELSDNCSTERAQRLLNFLEEQGAFRFPTLANGLFSAAAGEGAAFELSGYRNVWLRDNVHIANAHFEWGDVDKAVRTMKTLTEFHLKYQHRFRDIIEGRADPSDPMNRPHIRFDGNRLLERDEKWSHAQNDALGAYLWLAAKMRRQCDWNERELGLLSDVGQFLGKIHYWQDEDSGHWEEVRKIAASSIGVATAALESWGAMFDAKWKNEGRRALNKILPSECIQPDSTKHRRYDSALLFLIYPYQVVTAEMADQIVGDVTQNLMGDYGIRRYLGDSYWCADYRQKLSAEVRTSDFSDNLTDRDKLLEPGFEAQWCLFDPIISIHYGLRYDRTRDPVDRSKQIWHLNRSLRQITTADSRFPAYRCPESYFCEEGRYVPNDICPLLWTAANLKLALTNLIRSLKAA